MHTWIGDEVSQQGKMLMIADSLFSRPVDNNQGRWIEAVWKLGRVVREHFPLTTKGGAASDASFAITKRLCYYCNRKTCNFHFNS